MICIPTYFVEFCRHPLRHTFVSLLVKENQKNGEGISILDVCAIVGHKDAQVTLSVYAGLFPNSTERAMKVLNMYDAIEFVFGRTLAYNISIRHIKWRHS